ncbi:flavin reductase family protein [Rossellomorea sp. DA94]|uniref:flavin reductase family protein n=1 Tax=Rossellomorea sp. DA94 TaxID=3038653 RepID=UPI00244BAF4D|nr:flavin reductase family protein [Rossellomorea sp. DA94]WGG46501.1 flavin reductase family protein [Rossellomorea sp. DA94]
MLGVRHRFSIAWVSTISESGELNLAPFSFFSVASRNPPMLSISVGPGVGEREGTEKDTLVNIRGQKEFVINVVITFLGNEMQKSAENLPSSVGEFEAAGVTGVDSVVVRPKRVKEAPIQMECRLEQIIQLGSDHLIIGRMIHPAVYPLPYPNIPLIDLMTFSASLFFLSILVSPLRCVTFLGVGFLFGFLSMFFPSCQGFITIHLIQEGEEVYY